MYIVHAIAPSWKKSYKNWSSRLNLTLKIIIIIWVHWFSFFIIKVRMRLWSLCGTVYILLFVHFSYFNTLLFIPSGRCFHYFRCFSSCVQIFFFKILILPFLIYYSQMNIQRLRWFVGFCLTTKTTTNLMLWMTNDSILTTWGSLCNLDTRIQDLIKPHWSTCLLL